MSWAKFDDRFPSHLKVLRLSDAAFRLFVTSVCVCCEQLTDGRIDAEVIASLPRAPQGAKLKAAIAELVGAGLWEVDTGGWLVHDFSDWNPPADHVRAKRDAARDRMRRARDARQGANVRDVFARTGSEPTQNTARSSPNPVPVPVPDPETTTPKPPEPPAGGGGSGSPDSRIRCPVPLPIPDDSISGLFLDVGMPADVARAALQAWARDQSAVASDQRPLSAWIRCGLAAVRGRWSDPRRREDMRAAVRPAQDRPKSAEEPVWR
jgi:hypothetical protein